MRAFAPLAGLVALAAATALTAGLANAGDRDQRTPVRANDRSVLICATDVATRRAFTREHGVAPVFVTAREVLSVRRTDPAWTAPRCMTAREYARYREATLTLASAP